MGKRTKAVHLLAKRAALHTAKNCIPTINLPKDYDPTGGGDVWSAIEEYRKMVPKTDHIPIKDRKKPPRNKPWYFLTKEESITINNRHKTNKMTHDDYVKGYINHKLEKWKKKHPEPQPSDLFYKEEHPKWVMNYEEYHDKVVGNVSSKYVKRYTRNVIDYIFDSRSKYSRLLYAA